VTMTFSGTTKRHIGARPPPKPAFGWRSTTSSTQNRPQPVATIATLGNSNIIKLRQAFFLECEKEGWPPQWDGVPRVKPCYKGIDKYNDYGNGCLLDDCIVALSQGQKTSPGFAPLIPNALITPSMFMFLLWASTVVRVGE
jgi:hypothetical protein